MSNKKRQFNCPVWSQRYKWVSNFLEAKKEIETVTDIGSGNGKCCAWYKSVPQLSKINFIDKDYNEINPEYYRNHYAPPLMEMIAGRRDIERSVDLVRYFGDAVIPDERLISDCIVMIEVIEHLVPEDVDRITRNIFEFYQPKYVVMTTPNREFNHLFVEEGQDPKRFRHPDHKFEWDRAEFAHYCQQVCNRYPYCFVLDGVGHFEDSQPYGPCTQIAAFQRNIPDSEVVRNIDDWVTYDILLERLTMKDHFRMKSPKSIHYIDTITVPGDKRPPELRVTKMYDSWDC